MNPKANAVKFGDLKVGELFQDANWPAIPNTIYRKTSATHAVSINEREQEELVLYASYLVVRANQPYA